MTSSQRRRRISRALAALGAILCGAVSPVPVALAQPGDDPCQLGVTFLCHFMPIAPDWEGDIDLTQNAPTDAAAVRPDERKPADYCFNGCI
ncbi:fibronectin-binding protein [Mycolicibacterium parafortuitum]|uniref:Fibronectin-binding protein n=1 Tax=Mycolicibacterium parafortuitum TaxID=39692 RepID=A0A375YIU5_MYCPF|nr:fibronectin-binding protein [Mycolicibacterium parafortuitum]SRX81032.1 hypothetical protein MPP7335_02779 [Mycolicibacterium parafortuitum]